jgi:divalent metal cation (Fe/Co/Zn/Cd) transporter
MAETAVLERAIAVRHGRRLEYFTIAWNALEGLVAVIAGAVAGSVSLVGFGIDSFIEVTSGSVLLWRMSIDADVHRRERNERRALQIVGVCFLCLAAYIAYESATDLWSMRAPEHSIPGIVLACVSLVVMPLLSRAKRRVGRTLGSAAMHADAKQTCGGPIPWRASLWFPSSRKKASKDCTGKAATIAARRNYFFERSSAMVGASPV